MTKPTWKSTLLLTCMVGNTIFGASAAELLVEVQDSKGAKLSNAVVYVENEKTSATKPNSGFEIEQKSKQFNPQVSVIQTGTSINFPNRDKIRHHVYSFSPAKKFELKLYSGVPANPVLFDKAGTVVLGCNIHDSMLAYVHIVDTPYFEKTGATGQAKLVNMPEDNYTLRVWHYALKQQNKVYEKSISVKSVNSSLIVSLDIDETSLMESN